MDNIFGSKIFCIFYRFLKNYDIPIKMEALNKIMLTNNITYIDCIALYYLTALMKTDTKIELENVYPRFHLILDYLWCEYVYQFYDNFKELAEDSQFRMRDKEIEYNVISDLTGKILFHRLQPKQKKIFSKANLYMFKKNE